MIFSDWRTQDISNVKNLRFDTSKSYLLSVRAVGPKGYLGGRHTYLYFYYVEDSTWLLVELSDIETLTIQKANVLLKNTNEFYTMSPFISNRSAAQKWFGAEPVIIDTLPFNLDFTFIRELANSYPFKKYKVINQNCNTFISYLNYHIHQKYKVSFNISFYHFGYKPKIWWSIYYKNAVLFNIEKQFRERFSKI